MVLKTLGIAKLPGRFPKSNFTRLPILGSLKPNLVPGIGRAQYYERGRARFAAELPYHTLQAFDRTIFCPALQLKAWPNSGILETTLSIRYTPSECGSVCTTTLAICGRMFEHHA